MTSPPETSPSEMAKGSDRWRRQIADVLANWRSELALLANDARVWMLPANALRIVVAFHDDDLAVAVDGVEKGRLPTNGENPALAYDLALLCGVPGKLGDVAIVLPQKDVLRPALRMPRASRRTLQKALGYELGRLSPLDADQLYFDFEARRCKPPMQGADVELRIVRRAAVDRAVAICHDAGLQIASIAFQGDPRPADWQRFPVDRYAFLRMVWRRWSAALLVSLAAVLFVAVIFAAYERGDDTAGQVDDEISVERASAASVERLEDKIRVIAAQSRFLSEQKHTPLLIGTLAEISRLLPGNSWLTEIEVSGNSVRIRGYSHAASDLIALIDGSNRFSNAQFSAPLVQDGPGGVERFDLTFQVRP